MKTVKTLKTIKTSDGYEIPAGTMIEVIDDYVTSDNHGKKIIEARYRGISYLIDESPYESLEE